MDAGNNETEYVLTESYELSDWDSDSVSFSIGYSTEFNFLGGKASIETGYALDWTKSFERSLHEEWSQSFSAQAYNSVVVSRTPVFVYEYDIQKADGTWNDKTVMQTAIPQGPVYEQLSVDAYNKFATEYNKYMADRKDKPTCYPAPLQGWHSLSPSFFYPHSIRFSFRLPQRVQPPHQHQHRQPHCQLRHQGAGQADQEDRDAHRAGRRVEPRQCELQGGH